MSTAASAILVAQVAQQQPEPWEEPARLIFGSVHRFRVGVWIACRSAAAFYPHLAAEELGFTSGLLNPKIYDHFEEAGMIEQVARSSRDNSRCKWYKRVDHPYWDIFRVAARVFQMGEIIGNRWDNQFKEQLLSLQTKLNTPREPDPVPEPDYERNTVTRTKNPVPGKRKCSKCCLLLPLEMFTVTDAKTGKRRADCKACYNERQRTRYVKAGFKVVTVEVIEGDECVGHPCSLCGQPFEVGQHVQGEDLHHEVCQNRSRGGSK